MLLKSVYHHATTQGIISIYHAQPYAQLTTNKSLHPHNSYSTSHLILVDVVTDNQIHNYGYSAAVGTVWNGSEVTSIHLFNFIAVSAQTTAWFISIAFKGARPRHSEMKWSAAQNFKCTFNSSPSYWHFGGNPSFLFLSFLPTKPMVYMCMCVCALQHLCPLIICGEWEGECGKGGGVMVIIFCDCDQGLKWLLQRTLRLIVHVHTNKHRQLQKHTQKPWKTYAMRIASIPPLLALPLSCHSINDPNMWIKI